MTSSPDITSALIALGFGLADDGTLRAPSGGVVTLTPIGQFLELRISIDGNAVTAVLAKAAIKICREGAA
jgi:hypothetical protein